MKTFIFKSQLFVKKPQEEVFGFFSEAANLDKVTPPWLDFEIRTPTPVRMQKGARINYRLRLHKIPIRWRTEITVWEPPQRFVDSQISGPYKKWIHEHRFEKQPNGTLMQDRVEYALYGGFLAPLIHLLFVKKDVRRIFQYRKEQFSRLLSS
ncbi:MAG: SRPBCC family protein [Calditrichia bacterium]